MRELEERYLKRLSELYLTIAKASGLFSCSEEWVWFREAQDRRCFWKYCE